MPKIAVYCFEVYDTAQRAWVQSRLMATEHFIDLVEGAVLLATRLEVDAAHVIDGIYHPAPAAG